MTTEAPNDPLFISSVARAMTVLRTIGDAPAPMAVSDIARSVQITQSTTWRICYTLQKLGYVRSDAQGLFSPGLQLLAMGHAAVAAGSLEEQARPLLNGLVARLDSVAGIAVRDGDDMVYMCRVESDQAMLTMNLRAGSRVPILTSAMGWAYLAALPEGARSTLLGQLRRRHAPVHARVIDALGKEMRRFVQDGFVLNMQVFHPNVAFVGVPFIHPGTGEVYAFNCGGVSASMTPAQLRRRPRRFPGG
ncbi:MAG: IclR family transcriptional regulator [Rubrivivax sp.]|nr:MAG: IclR family transcriptional regulator [Rubrivivax sp.]